jgi:predicted RNA-binding protein with RPS1 domain
MERATHDLEPWEVPPDEAYWQALLREGEYGEGNPLVTGSTTDPPQDDVPPEPSASLEQAATPLQPPAPTLAPSPELPGTTFKATGEPVAPPEGEQVTVELESPADAASALAGTLPGDPGCWELFAQYHIDGQDIELFVESYNRGGLLVRWMDVLGFVPASQLCDGLRYGDEESRMEDLADRVGEALTLRVIEVDGTRNRLILSERAARHIDEPDLTVLDELSAGDVCRGHITNLCTFGAFVDLGGVEGLIHISELSWGRVGHPSDVLESGQEVEVYVLNVDREQGRIGLSLKRLQPDPWDSVEERYEVDQVVEGTITNIVNFGAFVRLEEGLEGLIHSSQLTGGMMPSLYSLREGEQVLVRIHSIESSRHRIGLGLEGRQGVE